MAKISYGQWIGTIRNEDGSSNMSVVNIEKRFPKQAQSLAFNKEYNLRTLSYAEFEEEELGGHGKNGAFHVFDPPHGWVPIAEYWKRNNLEGVAPQNSSFVTVTKDEGVTIEGTFENDKKQKGTFSLSNRIHEPAAKADVELQSWNDFKDYLRPYRTKGGICFRGQTNSSHRLRTLFHRAGRNNMLRYFTEDFGMLCRRINSSSQHVYEKSSLDECLALLGLAQHHGYPTPLLDWSLSPYISAFFAFDLYDGLFHTADSKQTARVFIFEFDVWNRHFPPLELHDPWPQLTFLELPAHNNPRYLPQQAMASFTNIDDIERFIRDREAETGLKFLTTVDIPLAQRDEAYADLELMGITAATLFPGFDGICRSLRMRHFR